MKYFLTRSVCSAALWEYRQKQLEARLSNTASTASSGNSAAKTADSAAKPAEPATFLESLSLAVLLPLIEAQGRLNLALCTDAMAHIAQLLDKYAAFALRETKHDVCLGGLHKLLRFWLSLPPAELVAAGASPATLAASVVALATTSGSLAAYVHAMHVLKDVAEPGDMTSLRGYKALALLNSECVGV